MELPGRGGVTDYNRGKRTPEFAEKNFRLGKYFSLAVFLGGGSIYPQLDTVRSARFGVMALCVFCGNPADSKENLFPHWILRRVHTGQPLDRQLGGAAPEVT